MELKKRIKEEFGVELPITGPDHDFSFEHPIVLLEEAQPIYVALEHEIICYLVNSRGIECEKRKQACISRKGKCFDVQTLHVTRDESGNACDLEEVYYFDITACYGKSSSLLEKKREPSAGRRSSSTNRLMQPFVNPPVSIEDAFEKEKQAAEEGDVSAQFDVAIAYQNGNGVKINKRKAVKFFKLAAANGCVEANWFLSIIYEQGDGVCKSKKKAFSYLTLAADNGYSAAQAQLGFQYVMLKERDPTAMTKALHYLTLAAKNAQVHARMYLGFLYSEGLFVEKDCAKGLYYLKLAACQGCSEAQYKYGLRLWQGYGGPEQIRKGVYYLEKAARQQYPMAMMTLSHILVNGIGVEKNEALASLLLEKAVSSGQVDADQFIESITHRATD